MITVKKAGLTSVELRLLRDILVKSEINLMESYCNAFKDCEECMVAGLCRDLHSTADYLSKLIAKEDREKSELTNCS